jgi:hypothetical protein
MGSGQPMENDRGWSSWPPVVASRDQPGAGQMGQDVKNNILEKQIQGRTLALNEKQQFRL